MSNKQNTTSHSGASEAVDRGMAALETLATVWCAKTDVSNQALALAEQAGHEAADSMLFLATAIREFAKSAYMEGAYQHLIDSRDELTQVKADRDRIRMEIVGALTDAGIYMLAGDSDPTASGEIESAVRRLASFKRDFDQIVNSLTPAWDYVHMHHEELGVVYRSVDKTKAVVDAFLSSRTTPVFDLVAHLERQAKFSLATFGPGPRVKMVLDHIHKELIEIEAKPADLYEWVDVVLLALDGAWRAGFEPKDIAGALAGKLAQNEARSWPDWREQDPDKAIEHAHDGAEATAAEPMTYPEEMTTAIRTVLGRPNFTCIRIAHLLRLSGVEIAHKAEDEQANVIHFLLKFALRHGEMWADIAEEELMALRHAALKTTGGAA
jgi:hypothetical protein